MVRRTCAFFFVAIALAMWPVVAQDVSLNGKIIDSASKPVGKVLVRLVNAGLADTTGTDGIFALTGNAHGTPVKQRPLPAKFFAPSIEKGLVCFSLQENRRVAAAIYDIRPPRP